MANLLLLTDKVHLEFLHRFTNCICFVFLTCVMKKLPLLRTNMTWLQSWMLWKASSLILMSWSWLAVVALVVSYIYLNPWTYKQSHTPTVVQGGGGWGWWTPPWVFVMLQNFEQIWPLVENLWCALQGEVYIMGCYAAGGLWRHSRWPPSWPPSWILPKIRNR